MQDAEKDVKDAKLAARDARREADADLAAARKKVKRTLRTGIRIRFKR